MRKNIFIFILKSAAKANLISTDRINIAQAQRPDSHDEELKFREFNLYITQKQ